MVDACMLPSTRKKAPVADRRSRMPRGGFGATNMTAIGTFETCRTLRSMSAFGGKAECAGRPARSRWCKSITMKE